MHSFSGSGILRRFLRRVAAAKPTSAPGAILGIAHIEGGQVRACWLVEIARQCNVGCAIDNRDQWGQDKAVNEIG